MRAAQERVRLASSSEVLDRILQLSDNAGATDEHPALKYLAMTSPQSTVQAHADDSLAQFG